MPVHVVLCARFTQSGPRDCLYVVVPYMDTAQ